MEKRTTIQVEYKTLQKLKEFRVTKRDTYDEILNRFMENAKENNGNNKK